MPRMITTHSCEQHHPHRTISHSPLPPFLATPGIPEWARRGAGTEEGTEPRKQPSPYLQTQALHSNAFEVVPEALIVVLQSPLNALQTNAVVIVAGRVGRKEEVN